MAGANIGTSGGNSSLQAGSGTAADPFVQPAGPAPNCFLITPNDGANLAATTRGISFAVAGALKVDTVGGSVGIVIPSGALAAGIIHPLCVTKVYNTGTGATGIVGYY